MTSIQRGGRNAPRSDFDVTHPLRPVILAGVLSVVLFSLSAAIVFRAFTPEAPAAKTLPLTIFALCLVGLWAIVGVIMLVRRPSARERVEVWGRAAQLIIYCGHIACVWLIWVVMPYGSTEAQFMTVVLLTAYVPTQIICSPENTIANRVGIVAVLGSAAAFLATRGSSDATMLAVYIVAYGAVMFILSDRVRDTVRTTVAARLASEATALELERLLAVLAEEKDAKTRFISAASHDLGQPLQAAALFFDQTLRAPSDAARAKAVDGVRRAFSSAEQLLSHMLNHLRLEADAVEPRLSRVAVSPLLARIALQYGPAAESARIEIRAAPCDVTLMLDPVLIERAIGNLVHNAIHHSRASRLLLGARRHEGRALRIWVIDNGVGISRADAKHIFEDYFQGAAPGPGVRVGFGLGLSSVRRIAALIGGEAGLDARWRRGAAFYVEFPCLGASAPRDRAAATTDNSV